MQRWLENKHHIKAAEQRSQLFDKLFHIENVHGTQMLSAIYIHSHKKTKRLHKTYTAGYFVYIIFFSVACLLFSNLFLEYNDWKTCENFQLNEYRRHDSIPFKSENA